jgi:hypothetical protein
VSRKSRRKHPSQDKRRKKGRPSSSTVIAQQPSASQTNGTISQPKVPIPPARVPAPVSTPTVVQYPYISTELRRIGILSGIMIAILVVLALVLPRLL